MKGLIIHSLVVTGMVLATIFILRKISFTKNLVDQALA